MSSPTIEQIRAYRLEKQFLLDKKERNFNDIARMNLGLHSTDYWTPYLSVWSRIGDYDAEEVFHSLNSGKKIVRVNSFRRTNHVVHIDNLPVIIGATGLPLAENARKVPFIRHLSNREMDSIVDEIVDALKGGPLNTRSLKQVIKGHDKYFRWVLLIAMGEGKIIRATSSHARSTITTYSILEDWIGKKIEIPSQQDATRELVERYIELFGPVSQNDIAWWVPLKKRETKALMEDLSDSCQVFEIEGSTKYMTKEDHEIACSLENSFEDWTCFLPYEDHLPKGFMDRSWYIDEELVKRLFPKSVQKFWPKGAKVKRATSDKGPNQSGEIRPSIWYSGRVVGRWEVDEDDDLVTVAYDLYATLSKAVKAAIEEKKIQLEEFLNKRLAPISKK